MGRLTRHLIALVFSALVALSAAAQTVSSVPAQIAPRTTIPSDSNAIARPTWTQACRDRVAAAKASGKHIDLLFVGDSITEGWTSAGWGGEKRGLAVWDQVYAPRSALNFGVGADTTQNVLWRLDTLDVRDLSPKVTVLLIGTNNTRDTASDIAAGVRAILTKLQAFYPATKIILVSILPNARANALMAEANTLIRPMADGRSIFYFDLAAKMPATGDNWLGLGPDKLHPTQAGYQIWADAMEPLLTQLLGVPPAAAVPPK
jgi:lysophospholipase L1-like esterase